MELRKVEIDFSDAKVHWNPSEPEYSHFLNGLSSAIPYLEPFAIKVLRQAKEKLPPSAAGLRTEIDLFVGQEGRHHRLHARFNKVLREAGYEKLAKEEERLKADYARYLEHKDLKFCLAYCEGFETFGPILSGFFFDRAADLMRQWDEPTVYLWLWHFAEEFEHRTVCNYVYKAIYDDYWYRLYGLGFATVHLFRYILRVCHQMVSKDRKTGAIRGRLRSNARFAVILWRIFSYALPPLLLKAVRRSYDPGTLEPPTHVMQFLADASQRYGILEPA